MIKLKSIHIRLFISIFCILIGACLLYMSFEKTNNVTSFESKDSQIAVIEIDLSKKQKNRTLELVSGIFLLSIGLVLAIDTYMSSRTSKPKLQYQLTFQEKTIISLIEEGMTNKEIASELSISVSTVKTHTNNIYKKFNVHSRTEMLNLVK